jgi:hypothetical protein
MDTEINKFSINGQAIDGTAIVALLAENRKLEAIKWAMDNTHLGLKDSKDFVESIQIGKTAFFTQQNLVTDYDQVKVAVSVVNGKTTVKLHTKNGLFGKTVTPKDPEWPTVKSKMGNHPAIIAYEKTFNEPETANNSVFVSTSNNHHLQRWTIGIILVFLIYFTLKFWLKI